MNHKKYYFLLKQQTGGGKKGNILSVLDLYDVVKVNEKKFDNIVKKSPSNIKKTIKTVNNMLKELKKEYDYAAIVPRALSGGGLYWTDYVGDYLIEKYTDWFDKKYVHFVVNLDVNGKNITNDFISVFYKNMNKKEKEFMKNLLNKYFKNKYIWNGKNDSIIEIYY